MKNNLFSAIKDIFCSSGDVFCQIGDELFFYKNIFSTFGIRT
jgi:hypothetical protein